MSEVNQEIKWGNNRWKEDLQSELFLLPHWVERFSDPFGSRRLYLVLEIGDICALVLCSLSILGMLACVYVCVGGWRWLQFIPGSSPSSVWFICEDWHTHCLLLLLQDRVSYYSTVYPRPHSNLPALTSGM